MLALLFLQEVPLIVETCFDDTSARGSMVTGHCIIGLLSYIFSICLMHGISYLFTYILTCTIFLAQIYPNFSWTCGLISEDQRSGKSFHPFHNFLFMVLTLLVIEAIPACCIHYPLSLCILILLNLHWVKSLKLGR